MPLDGIVGPETLHELERIRPPADRERSGAMLREAEALRRMSASLEEARVALDPGHGPTEPGSVGATGLSEAAAAWDLSAAIAAELRRRGAEPLMLREHDEDPAAAERAARANQWGAEVCLSIHLNAHTDPRAEGSSCLYYGTETTSSQSGLALAEAIQDELTSRIGLTDGRTHPKAISILRETRMPAVQVEPCFVTNPREERLLAEEAFRRDVAIAIVRGLERFFGARPSAGAQGAASRSGDTPPHGQARLPA